MPLQRLRRPDGVELAWRHRAGAAPAVVFLPGYASDMSGQKATALDRWAAANGRACVLFDYSGCGASSGRFEEATLSTWLADALLVMEAAGAARMVLVGSSMGGWLMLLAALRLGRERVRGLVGVAAAPDFTDWGLLPSLSPEQNRTLDEEGRIALPSRHGAPAVYTKALIEDARNLRLLGGPIAYDGPVRLLHGLDDPDVPWRISLETAARLGSSDVQLTLIKGGDHRLSRDSDLDLLCRTVADMLKEGPCGH